MATFENPHLWILTYRGKPAPELGWVDRKEWRDGFGRVLEVTRYYGSEDYRATLLSPSGGLLVLREGKDPAQLSAQLKREARKLAPASPGESLLEKDGELYLSRPSDATHRDLTEFDLAEIEQYEVSLLRESRLGLRLNGRMVLSMIREIRRHRNKKAPKARKKKAA